MTALSPNADRRGVAWSTETGDPGLAAPLRARLRDGSTVVVRGCSPADEQALSDFLAGLCLEARRLRFFTGAVDIKRSAHSGAASGDDRIGLVALDEDGVLVAHAVCIELEAGRAEVAVEVADAMHGRGLGTILIEELAEIAERRGISKLVAEVLPENKAMIEVFRDGFDAVITWTEGVDRVEFPAASWRLARERYGAWQDKARSFPQR